MNNKLTYQLPSGKEIEIEIQELSEFVTCKELIESPFNTGKSFLPNQIEKTHFRLIIRCYISDREVQKIQLNSFNPQSICVEAIEKYAEKKWKNKCRLGKMITCNHRESQFEYWIMK